MQPTDALQKGENNCNVFVCLLSFGIDRTSYQVECSIGYICLCYVSSFALTYFLHCPRSYYTTIIQHVRMFQAVSNILWIKLHYHGWKEWTLLTGF